MREPTTTSRRMVLRLLAGMPLLAIGRSPALARDEALIARLIRQARSQPQTPASISQRMDFISRSLLGVRYRAHTLIGGPRRRERFVVRADAFDCMIFCEVVLAAAIARDFGAFETVLRKIRYVDGEVRWDARNHYFVEWCRHAVENKICRPVAIDPVVTIDKTVDWENFGRRRVSINAIAKAALMANTHLLASGDIIGFVSRRSRLDYFHTGLIAFGKDNVLLLRHASQSRGRVLDQRMDRFLAQNGVKYATLLRAVEPAPATKPG
jgi:N-acetylmuramoyl-L-alanine amidase-like